MIIAAKTSKCQILRRQLASKYGIRENEILISSTRYPGIVLLSVIDKTISSLATMRHVDVLQIDEKTAAELENSEVKDEVISYTSLENVSPAEQYEHFRDLLYADKWNR